MDAALRADQLTAHIVDAGKREKVRNRIYKDLIDLDAIGADDDGDNYKDGCDDVPIMTLSDIHNREGKKIASLKDLHTDLRRSVDSGVAVADEPIDELNKRGKYGYTPLHRAVIDNDLDTVRDLLSKKAKVDIEDASGLTPLQRALMRTEEPNMKRIIRLLREAE